MQKAEFYAVCSNKRWKGREAVRADSDYEEILNSIFIKYVLPGKNVEKYRNFMNLSNVLASLKRKRASQHSFTATRKPASAANCWSFSYLDRQWLFLVKTDITEVQQQQFEQEARLAGHFEMAETATAQSRIFVQHEP